VFPRLRAISLDPRAAPLHLEGSFPLLLGTQAGDLAARRAISRRMSASVIGLRPYTSHAFNSSPIAHAPLTHTGHG
jgi:hypothetical protein